MLHSCSFTLKYQYHKLILAVQVGSGSSVEFCLFAPYVPPNLPPNPRESIYAQEIPD